MPQVDIMRRWTEGEKLSLLAAAFAPGVVVREARRANVSTGQLYSWRKQLGKRMPPSPRLAHVYSAALAEGYGLTEIAETGRLREDANLMMESISKGVAAAERRFQRLQARFKGKDRDPGRRDQ
jgi:transposase-like protein